LHKTTNHTKHTTLSATKIYRKADRMYVNLNICFITEKGHQDIGTKLLNIIP